MNKNKYKIFVSYKYKDKNVLQEGNKPRTARSYVNFIQRYITKNDNKFTYYGEDRNESLEGQTEKYIKKMLKKKIFATNMTIVLISPGMKEKQPDIEQWIPWEILYSLQTTERKEDNGTMAKSKVNAMIAVILPDKQGKYDYYEKNSSKYCFKIINKNINNLKKEYSNSTNKSYIHVVRWCNFISNADKQLEIAYDIQNKSNKYDIFQTI